MDFWWQSNPGGCGSVQMRREWESTYSTGGAAGVRQRGRRQLLVAGERVRSCSRGASALAGQLRKIQLHVHVLRGVAARELHVVGQQLAL